MRMWLAKQNSSWVRCPNEPWDHERQAKATPHFRRLRRGDTKSIYAVDAGAQAGRHSCRPWSRRTVDPTIFETNIGTSDTKVPGRRTEKMQNFCARILHQRPRWLRIAHAAEQSYRFWNGRMEGPLLGSDALLCLSIHANRATSGLPQNIHSGKSRLPSV